MAAPTNLPAPWKATSASTPGPTSLEVSFPTLQETLEDLESIRRLLESIDAQPKSAGQTGVPGLPGALDALVALRSKVEESARAHRRWKEDWDERTVRLRLLTDLLGQWKTPPLGTVLMSLALSFFGAGDALLYLLRPASFYTEATAGVALAWVGSAAALVTAMIVLGSDYIRWRKLLYGDAIPVSCGGAPNPN